MLFAFPATPFVFSVPSSAWDSGIVRGYPKLILEAESQARLEIQDINTTVGVDNKLQTPA